MDDFKELEALLSKRLSHLKTTLAADIDSFSRSQTLYRLLEYGDDLCLVLKKEQDCQRTVNIGFPFPVYTFLLEDVSAPDGISVSLHLRGSQIRAIQRRSLLRQMNDIRPTVVHELSSVEEFRQQTNRICSKYRRCCYFDPYSFVGDSFIGLHFVKSITATYDLELTHIYSDSQMHLAVFSHCSYYDPYALKQFRGLAIIPDLVDQHWDRTGRALLQMCAPGNASLVIGRNMIIEFAEHANEVFHLRAEDPLLRASNIEDYMNRCLEPFVIPQCTRSPLKSIQRPAIIMNPFGSIGQKTISGDLFVSIMRTLLQKHSDMTFLIVGGFRYLPVHLSWVAKLRADVDRAGIGNHVIIRTYDTFVQLLRDIDQERVSVGLTADTSVAHFFNHIGLRNVTLFNLDRCDLASRQSLASDSPLGFCRYGPIQYPVLFRNNKYPDIPAICALLEILVGRRTYKPAMNYRHLVLDIPSCQAAQYHRLLASQYVRLLMQNDMPWFLSLFDPDVLVQNLKDTDIDLIRANWLLNPVFKLESEPDEAQVH